MLSNNQLPDNELIVYIFLILVFYIFFKLLVSGEEKIVNTLKLLRSLFEKISFYNFFIFLYLIFQMNAVYQYVKNKSLQLNPFIDEYVSISSNFHLFRDLDFSAGGFLGGTFSVYLTSGPLSAVGSVLGWNLFNNIFYARILNYFWIVLLFLLTSELLIRKFDLNRKYFLLFLFPFMLIIPWWQGAIYSLGEIPSLIILTSAILIFNKNRKLSLFLFGLSIFLGKFLNILIFIIFYSCTLIAKRSLENVFRDFIFFVFSLSPWMLLINFTYLNGNVFDYFLDLYVFITNNNASGTGTDNIFNLGELRNSILNTEYSNWNIYEKIRIGILPLIGTALIIKNKKFINSKFGNISSPITFSIIGIYIWFWILSPLKWMRYSQHITVLMLLLTLYFIVFEVYKSEYDVLIGALLIMFYFDNTKKYFIFFYLLILLIFIFTKQQFKKTTLIITISVLLSFDITYSVLSKDIVSIPNHDVGNCNSIINSDECRESYFSLFYE